MTKVTVSKVYDLEKRTLEFAKETIKLCNKLARTTVNSELVKQLTRAGASVGANYREANESLGKKDRAHRIRISRKEAKEASYWLELILGANGAFENDIKKLIQESKELRNIFTSIIQKLE